MIRTGLLSITFRKLSAQEIVALAAQAGIHAIEWGGDIHVPHGNAGIAAEVGAMTREAGLETASYGSYYYAGEPNEDRPFEGIVETAVALGAPTIRVWAGRRGSAAADDAYRASVVADSHRIADLAAAAGLTVDYEYHANTLTDTLDSALALLKEVGRPNVRTNWQPPLPLSFEQRVEDLKAVAPYLANVHVFHWAGTERLPLSEGENDWIAYLEIVRATGRTHYAMLEFVKNDDPQQFLHDAATLIRLAGASGAKE